MFRIMGTFNVTLSSGGSWQWIRYGFAEHYTGIGVVKHDLEVPVTVTFLEMKNLVRTTLGLPNDESFTLSYRIPDEVCFDPIVMAMRLNIDNDEDFETWARFRKSNLYVIKDKKRVSGDTSNTTVL